MKLNRFQLYLSCCLLATVVVFSNCDGDDSEGTNEPSNELIGTWTMAVLTSSNCAEAFNNGTQEVECSSNDCISWEFKEGGVLEATDVLEDETVVATGTYAIDGDKLTVSLEGDTGTGTFSVDADIFIYNLTDEELDCDIAVRFERAN